MTILGFVLTIAALGAAVWAAQGSGRRLLFAVAVLTFGVGSINPLIEAVVFGVLPLREVPVQLGWQLLFSIAVPFVLILALGKWRENGRPQSEPRYTAARVSAAAVAYTAIYLTAGMVVFPFVKDFYATKTLPPLGLLIGLQLIRGMLYVLYAWPWLRLAPRSAGLVLGLVYSIAGGVAALLVEENPYMPREVRMPHLVEVGVSNFIFGMAVVRLLGSRRDRLTATAATANE